MLRVENAVVRYDAAPRPALEGVSLEVTDGETVAVLGPSGCGKTTLLRAIAGLTPLASGAVYWDGGDLAAVPVHLRRFGLVFQDYALFPHRSVAANVAFGLRMQGMGRHDMEAGVAAALARVGLTGYGDRRVDQLSGGEAQRVALARTLAPSPVLVLLDEPLGSVDRPMRDRLLPELSALLADRTAVYVTHDRDEAFVVAAHLVVMRDGKVVQAGTVAELLEHPTDAFVATFLGL